MKALLVGRRRGVLDDLALALSQRGHDVVVAPSGTSGADVVADAGRVDVVAFGRAVDDAARRAVLDAARSRNPRAQRVDGLAPIIDLLVAQCEWAGRRAAGETDADPAVLVEAVPVPRVVVRGRGASAHEVEVVRHRLTPWFSGRSQAMAVSADESDAVAEFDRRPARTRDFISVRVSGDAVFTGDALGRLPLCR